MSVELLMRPRRVMMTLDAVGGVWRYALDLAAGLEGEGIRTLLVGSGPAPDARQRAECTAIGAELRWTDLPLDWLVDDADELAEVPHSLARIATDWQADLLHLNLPSQAAGLEIDLPVVVASHSCVSTWWRAVRGDRLPAGWSWLERHNALGFRRAEVVLVPSRSHGESVTAVYGPQPRLEVVHNAAAVPPIACGKTEMVLSAGRWWDEAKNGRTLDQAAAASSWPVVMAGALQGPNGERVQLDHARAAGELPPDEMRQLMREAAIFAAPSRYEPFGLAVLEAAGSGAALLLADIPTFRELWADAAIFVPPHEPAAFAEAIGALAEDPPWRFDLAERARRRAGTFTTHRQLTGTLRAYGTAMLRHAPAGASGSTS
jgi:glycosyltransferase involved in cell wall biosynthesis